jgi:hypothetical protein
MRRPHPSDAQGISTEPLTFFCRMKVFAYDKACFPADVFYRRSHPRQLFCFAPSGEPEQTVRPFPAVRMTHTYAGTWYF